MIRLHVVAEGQTEETFINRVLAPHLAQRDIVTDVHCITTNPALGRKGRGGLRKYNKVRKDINLWCKEDAKPDSRFTTMLDLYGLPRDFPGYEESQRFPDPYERVEMIEGALGKDVRDGRFIPYIQLHEFEALVLVDPRRLADEFIKRNKAIAQLEKMVAEFHSPELIDDGTETAPSKRILQEIPEYEGRKATVGPRMVEKMGLPLVREKCLHFHAWIEKLESLA